MECKNLKRVLTNNFIYQNAFSIASRGAIMKKYIIGFSVLLVVALFLAGCAQKTTVYPPQGQAPATQGQPQAPEAAPATAPAAMPSQNLTGPTSTPGASEGSILEVSNCESTYGIGWVPNSCLYSGGSFQITLKAVGKSGISGIAFYVTGVNGVISKLKDSTDVSYLGTQPYSFSIADLEAKVGGTIQSITAMPLKDVNGMENACFNQRLLVIKAETCRS